MQAAALTKIMEAMSSSKSASKPAAKDSPFAAMIVPIFVQDRDGKLLPDQTVVVTDVSQSLQELQAALEKQTGGYGDLIADNEVVLPLNLDLEEGRSRIYKRPLFYFCDKRLWRFRMRFDKSCPVLFGE